ncbi:MarR family winged helix-turn-helix transcriptional regulator [Aquirufa aurantiipilula]|uniref:MarR family winged helix-turn-helix transcriptional regulator n=1 Tax=Aquirufa aurantiipilula TaxID=2696561 RepID=UPI001CAA5BBA|nr:MarR family winged helix-turn-helix transcriptional regulator [Aquirufa aurantiipilula]MBZ1325282.1 winged helix-turn-helix transcriptional regulator [Aquirufa aurantiipilula]
MDTNTPIDYSNHMFLSRLLVKSYRIVQSMNGTFLRSLGYANFKIGHIIVLMNLAEQGVTTTDLAKKAKVSKQAMSKLVNELIQEGYLISHNHPQDLRSSLLFCTEKGNQFLEDLMKSRAHIEQKFAEIIGQERLLELNQLLSEIVSHYDDLESVDSINDKIAGTKI